MNRSIPKSTPSRDVIAKRNAADYRAMNDIDDRRAYIIRAASSGPHEPSSAFGHYDVEDVDDGGRLIERRERGIGKKFVPISELPADVAESAASDAEALDLEQDGAPSAIERPTETAPGEPQIEEIRYLVGEARQTPVILRRRSTLRAI